jgi:hypothetical protein
VPCAGLRLRGLVSCTRPLCTAPAQCRTRYPI